MGTCITDNFMYNRMMHLLAGGIWSTTSGGAAIAAAESYIFMMQRNSFTARYKWILCQRPEQPDVDYIPSDSFIGYSQ